MPEVETAQAAAPAPPKKLFRSDPDLPPAVTGVADVLQDGVEALLKVVDTKVKEEMSRPVVFALLTIYSR